MAAVQEWLAQKAEQGRLEQQWQDIEHALMERCKGSRLKYAQVSKGRSQQALALRALMSEIKAIDGRLDQAARRILAMRSTDAASALALIELGLAMQEPLDCEEHAWALLRTGADRLRAALNI